MEETLFIIEQKRQNLLPGEVEASQPQALIETSETSLWMSSSWTNNGGSSEVLGWISWAALAALAGLSLVLVKRKEEWNKKIRCSEGE